MRKMKTTISNPIYRGEFTRAVDRNAQDILSKKPRNKKKASKSARARRNAQVHRKIEAQRQLAAKILADRGETVIESSQQTSAMVETLLRASASRDKLV